MAIVGTQGGEQEVGGMEEPQSQEEKQRRRERVVLLMHDTKVLTASDATRLLLLLAQEVCALMNIGGEFQASTMGFRLGYITPRISTMVFTTLYSWNLGRHATSRRIQG